MRRYGIFLACSAVALLMFVIASEAQQGGGKKGGGGFGFGGGGDNPVSLLQRADVKKELDVTTEQMEKLPGALMKAVGEVLNDKQMKRFRELDLQKKSTAAFKDEKFRKDLNVSESQHKTIDEILADSAKEMKELMADAKGAGGFKGIQEKFAGLQKETKEKVFGVLNADQKKTYKQMVGEEFKFEQPKGFGGGAKKDINE